VVIAYAGADANFCAATELLRWKSERRSLGLPDDGPFFCHADGSMITVHQIRDIVKALMQAAGLDPRRYGAHSLRIGGATAALAAGVPPQLIRLMGRWSSDIYQLYCRMSIESALGVSRAIANATVSSFESCFREEALELQPKELEFAGSRMQGGDDDDEGGVFDVE
jgi:hypothetical protein